MDSFAPAHALVDPAEPPDLVRAAEYVSAREAREHGLVILAMGQSYWLEATDAGYGLLVEAGQLDSVQSELALYDRANANWPPKSQASSRQSPAVALPWFTPLLWATTVAWLFWVQTHLVGQLEAWGALDAVALWQRGEWWRVATALFLHADVLHVLGNVSIGAFVFTQWVVARGVTRAWITLGLASVAANGLTAAVHLREGVTSLGASTAVFAGIGLLTGDAVRRGWKSGAHRRWRDVLVPLSAGVVLLAWLGAGDAQTDVVAHAAGFVMGLLIAQFGRDVARVAGS